MIGFDSCRPANFMACPSKISWPVLPPAVNVGCWVDDGQLISRLVGSAVAHKRDAAAVNYIPGSWSGKHLSRVWFALPNMNAAMAWAWSRKCLSTAAGVRLTTGLADERAMILTF